MSVSHNIVFLRPMCIQQTILIFMAPGPLSFQGGTVLLGDQSSFYRSPADAGCLAWFWYAIEGAQFMDQPFESNHTIADLGAVFRGRHHHTRRQMGQPHRRLGAIDMLTARTGSAVGIQPYFMPKNGAVQRIGRRFSCLPSHGASSILTPYLSRFNC